jgi:hypothetical protein
MMFRLALLAIICEFFAFSAVAEDSTTNAPIQSSPRELVRLTISNELQPVVEGGTHLAYTVADREAGRTRTKRVVETANGNVSIVTEEDGQKVGSERLHEQEQHLLKLVNDPAAWAAQRKKQQRDDSETNTLLQSIPDAFNFTCVDTRQEGNRTIISLKFSPDPSFHPPSRESQVFQGMRGVMEITWPEARITRIEGTLFESVNFGWGILGRLDPGGKFLIEQAPVGGGRWEVTHTALRFTGKVLLVKKLSIDEESRSSGFRAVPPLVLSEAVHWVVAYDSSVQGSAVEAPSTSRISGPTPELRSAGGSN